MLEIERFEWAAPDRIELAGRWSGLRGRRFIRPTLVLRRPGETKRLLASLEHKPWDPEAEDWIAVFAWDGDPEKFESAELHVGAGIDLELPRPRMRPGKASTRFRHRAVSRTSPVTEAHELIRNAKEALAPEESSAAQADAKPESSAAPADAQAEAVSDEPQTEVDRGSAELERIRAEIGRLRGERDAALAELRAARAAVEEERQAREAAVAAARSEGREGANPLLEQAAQLRAGVERQREMAFLERDDAFKERDEARAAEATALEEKKRAVAERKEANRDRDRALAERDRALKDRERAVEARMEAEREHDRMRDERDQATEERDTIVSLHERDLPIHQPQPKFWPRDDHSAAEVWAPRAVALALLLLFAFVVLRLFAGL